MSASDPRHTIAFAGVPGANADLACREAEPYMETLSCGSFEAVFDAVESGKAIKGMIPIENSQAGRVAEIHALLPETELHIVAEHFQHVQHCLSAPKGATIDGLAHIYSHPQALLQCKASLKALSKIEQHIYSNTAIAARDVADWGDKSKAAICSPLAAELYGLEVIEPHLEDSPDNTTVFILLSKDEVEREDASAQYLSSVIFSLSNIPAALYKVLGGFATNGINMQKLESYIPGGVSQAAQFFITFEGHKDDAPVVRAMHELAFYCDNYRLLGSYPASPKRQAR